LYLVPTSSLLEIHRTNPRGAVIARGCLSSHIWFAVGLGYDRAAKLCCVRATKDLSSLLCRVMPNQDL